MKALYGCRNFIRTSAVVGIGLVFQEVLFHFLVKDFLKQMGKGWNHRAGYITLCSIYKRDEFF